MIIIVNNPNVIKSNGFSVIKSNGFTYIPPRVIILLVYWDNPWGFFHRLKQRTSVNKYKLYRYSFQSLQIFLPLVVRTKREPQ